MTKKSTTKNGSAKPLTSRRPRSLVTMVVLSLAAAVTILAAGWLGYTHRSGVHSDIGSGATPVAAPGNDYQVLMGRWQRDDGYVIEIRAVAESGVMDAAYFNPRPIHVAKAQASSDNGTTRLFIELQDVNYPGSAYNLTYDRGEDRLVGTYFQAIAKDTYAVSFSRLKS